MIEWCFTPLSTVFQLFHGDNSHYSCLSWVSPALGWGSEVSCPRIRPRKTQRIQRIQCSSNPGPLDYESNTLPLSYAGPHFFFFFFFFNVGIVKTRDCMVKGLFSQCQIHKPDLYSTKTQIRPLHHKNTQIRPLHHKNAQIRPLHHKNTQIRPRHHKNTQIRPLHHKNIQIRPLHHKNTQALPLHHKNTQIRPRHHKNTQIRPLHHKNIQIRPLHHKKYTSPTSTLQKYTITSNFSFSHSVRRTFRHLHENKNFRLQILSVWESPTFVVWERVKDTQSVPLYYKNTQIRPLYY